MDLITLKTYPFKVCFQPLGTYKDKKNACRARKCSHKKTHFTHHEERVARSALILFQELRQHSNKRNNNSTRRITITLTYRLAQ